MRILFSGGGGAGNEVLWRMLSDRYDLFFGDAEIDSINPLIPEDRRIELPWASDFKYVHKIAALCKKHNIDLLVPGVDEELTPLADCSQELKKIKLFLPDSCYVRTMLDKLHMINTLKIKGINVPFTKKASDGLDNLSFPCIIKPRVGRGSRGVAVLHDEREAGNFIKMLDAQANEYILQEKMNGVEYTVQMISDEKTRLRAIVPVKVLSKRGITLSAVVDPEKSVIKMCRSLHESFPTKACYNIQLILSDDGLVRPFEINPRISTTFCLTIASGIDPFNLFLHSETENELLLGREGITLRRFWNNVINQ